MQNTARLTCLQTVAWINREIEIEGDVEKDVEYVCVRERGREREVERERAE